MGRHWIYEDLIHQLREKAVVEYPEKVLPIPEKESFHPSYLSVLFWGGSNPILRISQEDVLDS